MKGHKADHHKHRETGGRNDAAEDLKSKPMRYTADSKVDSEAEEKKRGGRTKRKAGGPVEKKHEGEHHMVSGEHAKPRMDRKPRKNGGRTGSDTHPFTSARHGTPAPGRKLEMEMD